MSKQWEIYPEISGDFKNQFPEINPIILQLLYNRGLKTQEEIDEFLLPDYSQDIADPFLLSEMEKAVKRIYQAIKNKEKILIYGDYDTDGVCSTALLYKILQELGAEPETYIPDREKEGYSLNKEAIKSFIEKKINLIITCDCGISNKDEVKQAQEAGIEVIITDHHQEPKELPQAYATINPQLRKEKYPFRNFAGVGVAFKLVQALLRSPFCFLKNKEALEKWFLDLVALGTIADLMPLVHENRTICKYGLLVLNKTRNPGLKALIKASGLLLGNIEAWNIAYQLSPRLNVSGRIDHANQSLKLLLADEKEAYNIASKINSLNKERQRIVEKVFQKLKTGLGDKVKEKILVIYGKKIPVGILGLIANKLLDAYSRPVIVLTEIKKGIKASGRSVLGFDLFANLSRVSDYFEDFGGHKGAAGFILKNSDDYEKFKRDIEKIAEEKLKEEDLRPVIKIDTHVKLSDINWKLQEELLKFEPYGQGNPKSLFLLSGVNLENIELVGNSGQHRRLVIDQGKKMIYFNSDKRMQDLKIGDKIDVVFELGVNQWNGQQSLEMKVIDLKKH